MSEKMPMNVDLRNVQEKVEDSVKGAQDMGRKLTLATIGFWGLAYDWTQDLWKSGNELVDKAEKRGEEIEHEWNQQFNKLQEKPEVKKVVDYVEDQVDGVSKNAKSVVAEVEKFLAQFQGKAEEVAKEVVVKVEEVAEAVLPNYDEMPAKDIVAQLGAMPKEKLIEIREYEVKNKNRVTVLREIDALLVVPAEDTVAA
jgi:chemotaxis regulatin CheY-phosphate phosphatase CheZ